MPAPLYRRLARRGGRREATMPNADTMKRTLTCLVVPLVLFLLAQCSMSTKIADIRNNPRQYADKEVTVSGEVTGTFSLVVIKYFTLRDSTGEMTIVTQRPLPKEGERLKVRGTVREAFSIGSESLLVIVEQPDGTKPKETK
jgi:hypothetical protein